MRKFLIITLPIAALVCFSIIMLSGNILKKSLVQGAGIPDSIQLIVNDVNSDNWAGANEKTESLSNSWDNIVKKIQFSSERDEINSFNASIARLRGAIMAQDKSACLMELNEAYEHWDGLGK